MENPCRNCKLIAMMGRQFCCNPDVKDKKNLDDACKERVVKNSCQCESANPCLSLLKHLVKVQGGVAE